MSYAPKTTGFVEASEQDVCTSSATARAPVGAKAITPDGRTFRYAKNAAVALAPGKLCVAATLVANHTNIAVAAAAEVGATQVTVTLGATAATSNQYAEGYMVVNDAAGEGITYKVKSHPAADASASLVVDLDEGVQVALTTSSEVSFIPNLYADVVVSIADQADAPVGVPIVTISASEYGWLQTGGPCAVLADETTAAGNALTIGSSVVGAVEVVDAAAEPVVGIAMQAGTDTEYRPVNLTLDR